MRPDRSSRTALEVARCVLYAGRDLRMAPVLPPGRAALLEKILLARSLVSRRELDRMGEPWLRRAVGLSERLTIRGMPLFFALRKRYFDDVTRRSIAAGAAQVAILGAGLDPLGLATALAHPQVRVFEIDHPATQEAKRRALASLGETPPNLVLLPADLTGESARDVLQRSRQWVAGARTLAIAEGLLEYLAEADVRALFEALASVVGEKGRFVFSFMDVDAAGRPSIGTRDRFGLSRALLALVGEPLLWGIAPKGLRPWLRGLGFDLYELVDPEWLRQRYLAGTRLAAAPLSGVECFAIARRRDAGAP